MHPMTLSDFISRAIITAQEKKKLLGLTEPVQVNFDIPVSPVTYYQEEPTIIVVSGKSAENASRIKFSVKV